MIPGLVPVGGVVGFMKSLGGVTPAATDDYAECNGQVLNDPQSPLNGSVLPPLNATIGAAFIRGAASSGGSETVVDPHRHIRGDSVALTEILAAHECYLMQPSNDMTLEDITPPYYETVYMMRIK